MTMPPFRQFRGRYAVRRRSESLSQVERELAAWNHAAITGGARRKEPSAGERFPDDDAGSVDAGSVNRTGSSGAGDAVADLQAQVAALQAALDRQADDLLTA